MTFITDRDLAYLTNLLRPDMLVLSRTSITDTALDHIKRLLTNLGSLDVDGTAVRSRGARELQKAMPDMQLYR
jgi:hypothetical protein